VTWVDCYTHVAPPAYFAWLRDHAPNPGQLRRWLELDTLWDLDARFRLMDTLGDYRQVLTLSMPPIELLAQGEAARDLARRANHGMADLVSRHPDRFAHFVAAVALDDVMGAIACLDEAVDQLGAIGVQIPSQVRGTALDHPDFLPFFAEAHRRALPIWLHPARGADMPDYRSEDRSRYEIWWTFGWPYETSAAMARLVLSGLFDRLPGLIVIAHHLGATIPYLEGRLASGLESIGSRTAPEDTELLAADLERPIIDYFREFHADTAVFGSKGALACGLAFFDETRVMFGSDFPFDPEGGARFARLGRQHLEELVPEPDRCTALSGGNLARLVAGVRRAGSEAAR